MTMIYRFLIPHAYPLIMAWEGMIQRRLAKSGNFFIRQNPHTQMIVVWTASRMRFMARIP
ncbi:MAG: hypothetical protein LBO00_01175 [Zoogloeaceae bacterium]|nr:hypothetical protein [Zoogloeaceae bacterium]